MVAEVQVIWDTAVPTHAVQLVQLMLDNNRLHRAWPAGQKFLDCQITGPQREKLVRDLVASACKEWQEARKSGMDATWRVIEQVAHEFHTGSSGRMPLKAQTRGISVAG